MSYYCARTTGQGKRAVAEELAGKVAVVTGGASGIGRACVERFLEEGARVVIADIDVDAGEEAVRTLGDDAAFLPTDVTDADQVQALVDFAVDHFGGLHVLSNNAGVASSMTRFLHDDLSDKIKKYRFRFKWNGKTYNADWSHDHSHDPKPAEGEG